MAKPISQFFLDLGYPFKNPRWSWGARRDDVIILRTWEDEYSGKSRQVVVLDPDRFDDDESCGFDERIGQLRALWGGTCAGYTVIVEAKDTTARPRKISSYRDDAVFVIHELGVRADGAIVASLSGLIDIKGLSTHAHGFRTKQGQGPFPIDAALETGISSSSLLEKLPAFREWLIGIARKRTTVRYGVAMKRFGLGYYQLYTAMRKLGRECVNAGEPVLTSLLLSEEERCSDGFQNEFGIEDDAAERERCYVYWRDAEPDKLPASLEVHGRVEDHDSLEARAERFVSVLVRPSQSSFRRAVFLAYGGCCAISGCSIPEALEAAHLRGRDWRAGHNSAQDGVLLRRDLHALYDRELLSLADGVARFADRVNRHYYEYEGVQIPRLVDMLGAGKP
ncbi:HNH endonuclease [Burkholderia arboris]|uniref:HNH endonuclease n=1 Tax=Burkholderia arboris TaxID=488730 RepID=UPI001CF54A87|nr:HNH endonuclease signature motif containing protein [Burkholderia arboris]MCA8050898.1 HNH endonuclease [Burkholderia arboris]